MKNLILLIAGLLSASLVNAQSWSWATSMAGRSAADGATAMDRDAAGNVYVIGDFEGSKLIGNNVYTAVGLADAFLCKYDASGAHQWTVQINGTIGSATNIIEAGAVTVDATGNIYVAGNFSADVVFAGTPFYSNFTSDAFIAKYSPSGTLIWARHLTGAGDEKLNTMKCLGTDIYLGGQITQAANCASISFQAPPSNFYDAIILKIDSAGNGVWGLNVGGNGQDLTHSLSVSPTAIYWAGSFTGTANFLGTTATATGAAPDMFVLRLNGAGQYQWVKRIGSNYSEQMNGITQDNAGNPVCTGIFYGDVTFATGIILREAHGPQTQAGNGDAFVCKLSEVDGTCLWARHIRCVNGDNNEFGSAITNDPGGSSYVTGAFNGNTRFSSTGTTAQTGTDLLATAGKDAFIAKYDANGNLLWVTKAGGTGNDIGKSIAWEPNGICVVSGNFSNAMTVGSTTLNATAGLSSVFIAKYDGLTAGVNETSGSFLLDVFPNPVHEVINVQCDLQNPIDKAGIYSLTGSLVRELEIPAGQAPTKMRFDIGQLVPGVYLLQVQSGTAKASKKITVY